MSRKILKKSNVKPVLKYFWSKYLTEKKALIILIVTRITIDLLSLLPAIYYKDIIDIISQYSWLEKDWAISQIFAILFIILWLNFAVWLFYRIQDFVLINFELKLMKNIYLECFDYIQRHSYKFFSDNFSWALVKKVNKLVYWLEWITDNMIFQVSSTFVNIIVILIIIWTYNIYLSLIILWWLILFIIIQYILQKWRIKYEITANEADSTNSWVLADTIWNNFNIRSFASLKRENIRFGWIIQDWFKKSRKSWISHVTIFAISWILTLMLEFFTFYVAIKYRGKGLITIGFFVLLQTYLFKIFHQMFFIWEIFKRIARWISESWEMIEILNTPHEIRDIENAKSLVVNNWSIEFKNVNFWYESDKGIFENFNLKIKSWEKVALVWESGSWKTTVIKILMRFFDIKWWEIFIDWQNIAMHNQDSLRGSLSMVPQDPVLFHRSLKENIAYGKPDASDQEIIAASKMARCHDFISWLKDWYETFVGERWIKLSWWERQRVAIARAILANKRILILDEATSSLDSESEKLIQEAMESVMKNKTVIVVAHRLSTIMKMDKIIVMDKWKIIESWSHKELLLKESWIYKKLWNIQSWWFIE